MIRLLLLPLLALLLPACSVLQAPDLAATDPSASLRARVTDWQLRGRVSLTRGEQGWHAGLDWENHADRYRLQVTGPLGQGALRLSGDAALVVLEDAEGRQYTATDAESLLFEVTGWELPVAGLRDWVRAVPAAGVPASLQFGEDGRITRLEQSGWHIEYLRYEAIDGMQWPTRLRMVRDDLALRLVVDQWQLAPLPVVP